jgi:hypothetical protein
MEEAFGRLEAVEDQRGGLARCVERLAYAESLAVGRAREHHKRMRVEILGGVERRALRIDVVEPSAVRAVLKGMAQRFEQRMRMRSVAGLREHEELAGAGHRAVARVGQGRGAGGVERLVRQAQRSVEAGLAPQRQDGVVVVFAQSGCAGECVHGRRVREANTVPAIVRRGAACLESKPY